MIDSRRFGSLLKAKTHPMAETTKKVKTASHPSTDKRFKLLEVTMKCHQSRSDSLIEILHAAQELFGFLSLDLLFIARSLKSTSTEPAVVHLARCASIPASYVCAKRWVRGFSHNYQ
jgi:hypothetical protein